MNGYNESPADYRSEKMTKRIIGSIMLLVLLASCANPLVEEQTNNGMMHPRMENRNNPMDRQEENRNNPINLNNVGPLEASKGLNELMIPDVLEKQSNSEYDYEITAQIGNTEFYDGNQTETFGYNGDLLGPTIRLQEGETVQVKINNDLDAATTVHWHGLEIPGDVDGGPSQLIAPKESKVVTLKVDQPSATLWYHPHPHGNTGEQVFKGLGGLLYIDGSDDNQAVYPDEYGVNDFPLIFQDRQFDENGQLNYNQVMNFDGTLGNVSLVNGTIDPVLTVDEPLIRFRMLNASNAREYTFRLSNGANFRQIASDGSRLIQPVEMNEITLTPSERVEVLVDLSEMDPDEMVAITDEFGNVLLPIERGYSSQQAAQIPEMVSDETFLSDEDKQLAVTKEIELFGRMNMVTINGRKFDPNRIDLRQEQGVTEVWEVYNRPDMMGGMTHPFHIHGTQFKVISRDGIEVSPNEQGLKDSVLVAPGERVKLLVAFPEKGIFPFHCHILEHEDNGMMGQIEIY